MNNLHPLDPALVRGLTQRRLGRRDALRIAGLSASAAALAACGVKGKATGKASAAPDEVAKFWAGKTKTGAVSFANWPLYMDPSHPELKKFTTATGIQVTYQEAIQDDPSWFAKIQPQLAANRSIGYDLMVVTDGVEFADLVALGYLAPLDHAKLPNFAANAGSKFKHEAFDPGNVYSVPWASGITGIAWDPAKVKEAPTSLNALWDPRYAGKVGMFSDTQEVGNFAMMLLGIDPEKSTEADWKKAAAKLAEQKANKIVRKYYEQDYIDDLGKGDIWLCQAWSGDVFQKNVSDGTNLQFAIPAEGGTLWTDNMMIPKTAENPVSAQMLIDFFYQPDIAASLTEYINYITPVPSAQDLIKADAAKAAGDTKASLDKVATSPLVFPTEADYAKLKYFRVFKSPAEKRAYDGYFTPIVTG